MKKRKYFKIALLPITVMLLFSSCLKDDAHYVDYSGVGVLIELPLGEPALPGSPNGVYQTLNYSVSAQPSDTLIVAVNVASPKPLPNALSVTLSVTDTTGIGSFNANTGSDAVTLPAADYRVLGSLTVTVPANQRLAYARILINAAAIGVANSGKYVLPVHIESAGGEPIAQPFKALFYNVVTTP